MCSSDLRVPDKLDTNVDGEFGAHPDELSSICLDLADTACVRLEGVDGAMPEVIY